MSRWMMKCAALMTFRTDPGGAAQHVVMSKPIGSLMIGSTHATERIDMNTRRTASTLLRQQICQLRRDGMLLRVIAERVGRSIKHVQNVLTKNKIYRREVRP